MQRVAKALCLVVVLGLAVIGCDNLPGWVVPIRPTDGAIQLPKTGADDGGAGVAWPVPRFVDNGDGTVTDKLTGIMWTKDANPSGKAMTMREALDYVKTVNNGGHTDWRLPNRKELRSLCDFSKYDPALPEGHPFTNVQSLNYWSSTSYAGYADCAWVVDMYSAYFDVYIKASYYYVWPVRYAGNGAIELPRTGQTTCYDEGANKIDCSGTGQDGELQAGAAWPSPRFDDNGDGTMTDKLTGLIWPKDANNRFRMTWNEAVLYVVKLNRENYLGKNDWRLPNINELESLINAEEDSVDAWLNGQECGFTNVFMDYYWSSTYGAGGSRAAWIVDMGYGYAFSTYKTISNLVWPVR